ncbi:MAG: TIGR04076 family protein [Desulfobacterales bacterium]|nr:TIGR04076 family protein [Desulfobacterales bacterium]
MADTYDVDVKVISVKGTCSKHRVGDAFFISKTTPEGICLSAFNSLLPDLRVLRLGGTLPWSEDPDTAVVGCPDPENLVVFELRRKRNKP